MAEVLEDLTDEEGYLWAILSDPSGLDLAEFVFQDPETDDHCFRAWSFQWAWWRSDDHHQIDQCARSVGKTMSITVRAYAFPFLHPGQEMVITAPELVHLEPLTSLVERRFYETRLGREMIVGGRSAVTHRPFQMNFQNGSRIIGRIPQRDGRGVKGIHPIWLELDEAQDFPKEGWTELIETLKRGSEGAVWRAHGVTRGVRDKFYEFTDDENPDNYWKVHRFTAMSRPNWTAEEREEKITLYKSRDDPDYRRNVLGMHGDATNPLFVLSRLMGCVDDDETSPYNTAEYYKLDLRHEMLVDRGMNRDPLEFLDLPSAHLSGEYNAFWAGMDVGYTNHPSEILVFGEHRKTKISPASSLKLVARLHLRRLSASQQRRIVVAVLDHYGLSSFAMDKTGNGFPLFQDLQEENPGHADRIKGYNFSEKILVDFDAGKVAQLKEGDDEIKEAGINKFVVEYATDTLRELVDAGRLELPWDKDLIAEFQGQTWSYSKEAMDSFGRRRRVYSEGSFHALDAARMAALGFKQRLIEDLVRMRHQVDERPVLDFAVTF